MGQIQCCDGSNRHDGKPAGDALLAEREPSNVGPPAPQIQSSEKDAPVWEVTLDDKFLVLPPEVQSTVKTVLGIDAEFRTLTDDILAKGRGKELNKRLKELKPILSAQKNEFPDLMRQVVATYNTLAAEIPARVNAVITRLNQEKQARLEKERQAQAAAAAASGATPNGTSNEPVAADGAKASA